MTHAYFMFYHSLSNVVLRRVVRLTTAMSQSASSSGSSNTFFKYILFSITVFILSYSTAFMETLTIANFKYYTFVDKGKMYR